MMVRGVKPEILSGWVSFLAPVDPLCYGGAWACGGLEKVFFYEGEKKLT